MSYLRSKHFVHYRRMTTKLWQKDKTNYLEDYNTISKEYFKQLPHNLTKIHKRYTKYINKPTVRGLAYAINKGKKHKKGWKFVVDEQIYQKK